MIVYFIGYTVVFNFDLVINIPFHFNLGKIENVYDLLKPVL